MSFGHWWFSCFLDQADYERLLPIALEADRKAVLPSENEEAIAYWRTHWEMLDESYKAFELHSVASNVAREKQNVWYDRFIWAFNLPGYAEFGETLVAENFVSEEKCFRFIITNRCSPVAVLWHAIGYERARKVPGKMGNLFLSAAQVAEAFAQINHALSGIKINEAVQHGMRLAGHSNRAETILDIITHFPEGLGHALKIGKGFLAIARPQL